MRAQHKKNINSPASRRWLLWLAGGVLPLATWLAPRKHRSLPLVLTGLSHATLLAALLWPNARLLHHPVRRFHALGRELWLTLDDGPDATQTSVLSQALADRGVQATFFFVGAKVHACRETVLELQSLGHEVANHTQNHPKAFFWALPKSILSREIRACSHSLHAAGAGGVRCFRAPVGMANLHLGPLLDECTLRAIGWSVRAYDGAVCDPGSVIQRVVTAARPGDILLMHEGKRSREGDTVSLPTVLAVVDKLLARGFRFIIPPADRWR